MAKIADLPEFDMADYLDNDEAVAQYLSVVLAEGDSGEFRQAQQLGMALVPVEPVAKVA